jgi:hypothetical protein
MNMQTKTLVVAAFAALSLMVCGLAAAEQTAQEEAEAALKVEAEKVEEAAAAVEAGAPDAQEKIEEAQAASVEAKAKQEAAGE